jgi:hydrogenase maturation factor
MKEWHRTVILLVLLGVLIGTFVWLHTGFENQALDTLR